jgi:hypothetical protein
MMTMPISLPAPTTPERVRLLSMDSIRQRALERLYERRAAVDNLIQSLEDYERAKESRGANCIDITSRRRWS